MAGEESKGNVRLPVPVPPDSGHATHPKNRGNLIILALFILFLVGVGYLLVLLPDLLSTASLVSRPPAQDTPPSAQKTTPEQRGDSPLTSSSPERNTVTSVRENLLKLKIQAETENITGWAAGDYRNALEKETLGNRHLNKQDYTNAAASYRLAIEKITEILDSREPRLAAALEKGQAALETNNDETAEIQFRLALKLDPSEEQAVRGLEKVEIMRRTPVLLSEAIALADSGKLLEAEKKLEHLLSLDHENPDAEKELEKIKNQRAETDFNARMSIFFSSLKTGDFKAASDALESLRTQWGTKPQFAEAERILHTRRESKHIAGLIDEAHASVQKENWEHALTIYKKILEKAPEAILALNGKKTAENRLSLDKALTESIAKPDRLQDIDQRETARKLLDHARHVEPSGPKLTSQTETLERLLTIMSSPVTITIVSDNLTEITIYRVGRMGHFFTRTQKLTPGRYTIVGTRKGFRDTRKTIEVSPESTDLRITLQCNEPI